jgi:hypothetical protein
MKQALGGSRLLPPLMTALLVCLCQGSGSAQQPQQSPAGQRPLRAQPSQLAPAHPSAQPLPPASAEPVPPGKRTGPLDPPPVNEVFRASSEANFVGRLRAEWQQSQGQFAIPLESPVAGELILYERPPLVAVFAPRSVCHGPLYFEQWKTERHGWRVPLAHPLISAGKFYVDAALLPVQFAVQPPWRPVCDLDRRPPFEDPVDAYWSLPCHWACSHCQHSCGGWNRCGVCGMFNGPVTFQWTELFTEVELPLPAQQQQMPMADLLQPAPVVVEGEQ